MIHYVTLKDTTVTFDYKNINMVVHHDMFTMEPLTDRFRRNRYSEFVSNGTLIFEFESERT